MRCLLITLLVLLLLALVCLLGVCLVAGGLAAWGMMEPAEPAHPSPPPPPLTPVAPGSLYRTEAQINGTIVPPHDPVALHSLLAPDTVSPTSPPTPTAYQVGDRRRFRLNGRSAEAELIHVTEHTYTWLVVGVEADRKALGDAAERFEAEIYPSVRAVFGAEWTPGIDGDPRLSILHYHDREDIAAGYFMPDDELPQWVEPTSNETEMFYINLDGMEPGEDFYFAVLAHEFQHMIHWNRDRNEANWLDEALAELACRIAGFDPGDSDETFRRRPDTQLNHWPSGGDDTANYGAGYRFALYLWERFGEGLIRDLAHHPANGMASLDAVLAARGETVTADQVFADWVLVNALDAGEYAYFHEDWQGQVQVDAHHAQYPVSREAAVLPYGTDYVELTGRGDLLLRFQGPHQTRLLSTDPPTGETFWWSNRGHNSDARLIRSLDLTGLSHATLQFQTWYDLEDEYDYVYLSASRDGATWEILEGKQNQDHGEYGPAYNGQSNGWVEEQVDLSPYVGGPVWIRFDYVTDVSINGEGFLVDDLSIPELGWSDPCDGTEGWQAEGFVLVGPAVPQRWIVQILQFPTGGGPVQVQRMSLDDQGQGQIELTLSADVERALVAISAVVRSTTQPASYWYEVTTR